MAFTKDERDKLSRLKTKLEQMVGRTYSQATWEKIRGEVRRRSGCNSYFSTQFENHLMIYGYTVKTQKLLGISKAQISALTNSVMEVVEGGDEKVTCEDYYKYLVKELNVSPPHSTKYKFFRHIGGFMKGRMIDKDQKIIVTYKVILWANNRNTVPKNITPDLKGEIENVK